MSSFTVMEQRLDELETLHAEAQAARKVHTQDAIARVKLAVLHGLVPFPDDMRLITEFIGARQGQNRYGK
jgi:hypothetical protein